MDVYYFVIFITFLLCYFIKVPANDEKAYRNKVIWVFVPILIFGALRVDFGVDYGQYEMWYYEWHGTGFQIDKDEHAEIGYQWLNIVIPSWRLLVILVSTSVVVAFMMMYSKYVAPQMLMLAMVFTMLYPDQSFFISFVTMRNGLAIAGVYLCLPLIIQRRYWLLIPLSYLLSLFHTSALFFLPMAMIAGSNKPLTKKEMFVWVGVVISVAVMSTTQLISFLEPLMIGDQFDNYKQYYLGGDTHGSLLQGTANALLIYFIISWAYRNRNSLTQAQNTIWRLSLLYLMSPFLGSLGRTRMTYYYIPFYIMTITYLMNTRWPNKTQKYLFIGLAVLVMLYSTFIVFLNNPHFVFAHYQSIFG